jgi:alkylation response protein AidB-like acyl-CoA dehydrogenase
MDFGRSPEEEAFADEVRRFLRAHPPSSFPEDGVEAGYGSGAHSRAFTRALGRQGWIAMCWPRRWGGAERHARLKLILLEELALAGAPFGPLAGMDQIADAIIQHGSPRLRQELLPLIAAGEASFWQGYSEPGSGSDLLSLTTEGRRDGDDWVIRGHKIWSSHAGIATHGHLLARTGRAERRSQGFTMFLVPNTTPGLDIRPIRSLTGKVYHYEVFLDQVRVPRDCVLGAEGEGFVQLLKGLETDRFWGRFYKAPALTRVLGLLVEYANTTVRDGRPLAHDPLVRRRLAEAACDVAALGALFQRAGWSLLSGAETRYESTVAKVFADETGQKVAALGLDLLGLYGPLTEDSAWAPLGGYLQHYYQTTMGHTIAGGTSEVLRSTIATRALGLPAEPRPRG